jgi:hypothetical protein
MRNGSERRVDLLCGDIAGARAWHRADGVWDSPQRRKCFKHETTPYGNSERAAADWRKSPVAQMFARYRQGAGLLQESVTNARQYWLQVKLAIVNDGLLEREYRASSELLKVETERLPASSVGLWTMHC